MRLTALHTGQQHQLVAPLQQGRHGIDWLCPHLILPLQIQAHLHPNGIPSRWIMQHLGGVLEYRTTGGAVGSMAGSAQPL